jgi:excisionase family DNA binding protein
MTDITNCSPYLLLSTAQVAAILGISKGAVRKLARQERLRAIEGFRVLYFPAQAVREFVNNLGG